MLLLPLSACHDNSHQMGESAVASLESGVLPVACQVAPVWFFAAEFWEGRAVRAVCTFSMAKWASSWCLGNVVLATAEPGEPAAVLGQGHRLANNFWSSSVQLNLAAVAPFPSQSCFLPGEGAGSVPPALLPFSSSHHFVLCTLLCRRLGWTEGSGKVFGRADAALPQ